MKTNITQEIKRRFAAELRIDPDCIDVDVDRIDGFDGSWSIWIRFSDPKRFDDTRQAVKDAARRIEPDMPGVFVMYSWPDRDRPDDRDIMFDFKKEGSPAFERAIERADRQAASDDRAASKSGVGLFGWTAIGVGAVVLAAFLFA